MKQIDNFYFNDNAQIEAIDEKFKPYLIQNHSYFYVQAINTSLIESIDLFKALDYKSSNILINNISTIINNNIKIFLNDVEKEIENDIPSQNKDDKDKHFIQYLYNEFLSYQFYIEFENDLNKEINVNIEQYGVKTKNDLDRQLEEVIYFKIVQIGIDMDIFDVDKNGTINLMPNYEESSKEYLQ